MNPTANSLNTTVCYRLPEFLDRLLFGAEGFRAFYCQRRSEATVNLYLNDEEIRGYLGTYFPRSLVEAYDIYKQVLAFPNLKNKVATGDHVSILSVGCGTGGDIAGLLFAIKDYRPNVKKISIYGIDGSEAALGYAGRVLSECAQVLSLDVSWHKAQCFIEDLVSKRLDLREEMKFDFVQSFKLGGELFEENVSTQPYYFLASLMAPLLKDTGVLNLLDVTCRVRDDWLPVLLNDQINDFVQEHPEYATLVPVSCGCWENNCHGNCYGQKTYRVTHRGIAYRGNQQDVSKVSYRVIGNRKLHSFLPIYDGTKRYRISEAKQDGFCRHSITNTEEASNFDLVTDREIA